MATEDLFGSRTRTLEDAFFLEQDKKLLEQLALMKKMKETKQNLKEVSGIENDKVLQKLVDLNIPPQIVASLCMVPLIEVAWADGEIGDKEKDVIKKAAHLDSEIDKQLLESWLNIKPAPHLFSAWSHYICGLSEKFGEQNRNYLKDSLLAHAYEVARAEGGFLGIGNKISEQEKAMLELLENAFNCDK